jgi:hypothetical protein
MPEVCLLAWEAYSCYRFGLGQYQLGAPWSNQPPSALTWLWADVAKSDAPAAIVMKKVRRSLFMNIPIWYKSGGFRICMKGLFLCLTDAKKDGKPSEALLKQG